MSPGRLLLDGPSGGRLAQRYNEGSHGRPFISPLY